MRWSLAVVLVGCATAPRPPPAPAAVVAVPPPAPERTDDERQATLAQFIAAVEGRQFDVALGLLSKPLRARYTAASLERDFEHEPLARARVARIKARLETGLGDAGVEWAPGHTVQLVREDAAWRIAALE